MRIVSACLFFYFVYLTGSASTERPLGRLFPPYRAAPRGKPVGLPREIALSDEKIPVHPASPGVVITVLYLTIGNQFAEEYSKLALGSVC